MTKSPKPRKEFEPGRGFTREDWDSVDSPELTDEELASMRPAREMLPPAFFDMLEKRRQASAALRGRPKFRIGPYKPDVLGAFKAKGPGRQAAIGAALREAIKHAQ